MALQVPPSLQNDHDALVGVLRRALRESGRTGEAARRVMEILDGHLMREEKFALRPLSLLRALARGDTPSELGEAARLTAALQREMPQMMDEHRQIAERLQALAQAAEADRKPEYVEAAGRLLKHSQIEEEVLYPAAQLVGRYAALVRRD